MLADKPILRIIAKLNSSLLENKRNKLTDMLLDDKISKDAYDDKYNEREVKLNRALGEKELLEKDVLSQNNVKDRMKKIREKIKDAKNRMKKVVGNV